MFVNEIARLIELNKRRAELEFKKAYLQKKPGANEQASSALETELAKATTQAYELESYVTTKGLVIFYPNAMEISAANSELSKFSPEQIYDALRSKNGEVYALLEKKGRLVKGNLENRWEIAELMEFANTLPGKVRDEVTEKVQAGKIGEMDVSILKEAERTRLFKLLNRAGIRCVMHDHRFATESTNPSQVKWEESGVAIGSRRIWVQAGKEEEVMKLGQELADIEKGIQIMNAERQIRKFSLDEETKFVELQKRLLEAIKARESMLSE